MAAPNPPQPKEFLIKLEGTKREDGTLFVISQSLPFFSAVVVDNEVGQLQALDLLRAYLEANLRTPVEVRPIKDAGMVLGPADSGPTTKLPDLPAHVIAEMGADC